MLEHPEGGSTSNCGTEAVAQHTLSVPRQDPRQAEYSSRGDGRYLSCEVRNGLATIHDAVWSYYLSRHDGRRMLVLELCQGERIRINGTAAVVVLEIHPDRVTTAIECVMDDATKAHG